MGTQIDNTGEGLKLGKDSAEKVSFFGATPVAQYAAAAQGSNTTGTASTKVGATANINTTYQGSTGTSNYTVSDLVDALKKIGILAE